MTSNTFNESFLPLRFFLHTVVVHCPSCHEKGVIKTDVPPVAEQKKMNCILDGGHIGIFYPWNQASFLCLSCQKNIKTARNHIKDTGTGTTVMLLSSAVRDVSLWHGPVLGHIDSFCAACKSSKFKHSFVLKKVFPSAQHLPSTEELSCPHCHELTRENWQFEPKVPQDRFADPIFGLTLYAQKQIKNEVLWVYNLEHLQLIRAYVQAKQHKKTFTLQYPNDYKKKILPRALLNRDYDGARSFSEQLPAVVKKAKNRESVLKLLDELSDRVSF